MGEQQLEQVTSDELWYVPRSVFRQLLEADIGREPRAAAFAALCRINVFYMIARAWSGHIGTCFSSVDIMTWLYLFELERLADGPESCDVFFSSKGHDAPALYSVLIGLGLLDFDSIHTLRQLGGVPGHPHVETPYVHANTGSLGMGISKAKGMAVANRLLDSPHRIFVLTGDGELQEGQIWESLPSAAHRGLDEITVIVDQNRIQSDTWVEQVSPPADLSEKFRSFGWAVDRCDGHDFVSLGAALSRLGKVVGRPKVLIAETVKGKGASFMEGPAFPVGTLYPYHSGAPDETDYARGAAELIATAHARLEAVGLGPVALESGRRPPRKPVRKVDRLVDAYARALVDQAERDSRIVVLDADLIKDCGLVGFRERFPDRFVECGIAEQDMVSQAGGMARCGLLPVVHSFACFLSARPNEQIYNNASEGTKVIYVGSLAGLLPGGPGHSHQAVRDISSLGAIPGLLLIEPSAEIETADVLDFCLRRTDRSSYIRLVSLGWTLPFDLPRTHHIELGRGTVVRDGTDAVVIAAGPWLLSNGYKAAEVLEREHGVRVKVVALPWLNRVDASWLREVVGDARDLFTLDNHYLHGGQGQLIASVAATLDVPSLRLTSLGVSALPVCGRNDEVLAHHQLDVDGLVASMTAVLEAPVT